jgi:hypothetical protein
MKEKVEEKKRLSVEDKFFFMGLLVAIALFIAWFASEYGKDLVTLLQLISSQ